MSENTNDAVDASAELDVRFATEEELPMVDELSELKERAKLMGIKFHPTISLDKLKVKVNSAVTGEAEPVEDEPVIETKPAEPVKETESQRRVRLKRAALKLVRIRVSCMNPLKKEWDGEIFTAGNAGIGTVKRFVPFHADDGWHVEQIIYQMMKDRKCQIFVNDKTARGVTMRKGKLINEFAIEVLPPLTDAERKDLAQRQAMSGEIA